MGQKDTKTKNTPPAPSQAASPGFCQVLAQYRAQMQAPAAQPGQPSLPHNDAMASALSKTRQ